MSFPSTPLINLSLMSDQGPPISGFIDPPGALNFGRMMIEAGLAQADSSDPDSPLGFTLLDQIVGPTYEAYVQLGVLDPEGFFGGVGVLNEAGNQGYLVLFNSDGSNTGLTVSTLNGIGLASWDIDMLSDGDWVGFTGKSGKITIWLKYGAQTWRPLGVVTGLNLPSTGRIGFGAIGVG